MTERHGKSAITTSDAGRASSGEVAYYEIKVQGHLESHWSEWFDALKITHDCQGDTILYGPIRDQAALHGLLDRIRDLGLPLLSVNRSSSERESEAV